MDFSCAFNIEFWHSPPFESETPALGRGREYREYKVYDILTDSNTGGCADDLCPLMKCNTIYIQQGSFFLTKEQICSATHRTIKTKTQQIDTELKRKRSKERQNLRIFSFSLIIWQMSNKSNNTGLNYQTPDLGHELSAKVTPHEMHSWHDCYPVFSLNFSTWQN